MGKSKSIHVVPSSGNWSVKQGGIERPISRHNTKQEAVNSGREVSRAQGGELVIHNRDGRIARKDSHGNDPFPPRG